MREELGKKILDLQNEIIQLKREKGEVVIDYSRNLDSDCEIKNVGNLCGYYPQGVNKNFKPNPPELKITVCGFPSIDGCKCVEKGG